VRIVRCCCLLVLIAVGALGCSSTSKNKTSQNTSPTNNVPFWKQADTRNPSPALTVPGNAGANNTNIRPTSLNEQPSYNGVLAGALVDAYGQRVQRAYVQVAPADGVDGKPIEITVSDSFFTVPGLTPGRSYMLTARTAGEGDRKLAGRLQAVPPQPRLVIKMSEELYSPSIPPVPSRPGDGLPAGRTGDIKGASAFDSAPPAPPLPDAPLPGRTRGDEGWRPDGGSDSRPIPNLADPPPPILDSAPGEPRIPPTGTPMFDPENIADRERDPRRPSPLINLPGPGGPVPPAFPEPDPPPTGSGPGAFRFPSQPRVPSCEFSGRRLVNFALSDLNGQPWEFRQHHGRLVLLDFWGTWCMPCMRAIPHLKKLQGEYGPYGLEVVGIACERAAGSERARRVRDAVDRQQINYRVVLGEDYEQCPVQQKFGIRSYPTLILLDGSGNILWRGDAAGLNQLEQTIQQQLRVGR
jgi:thiol-disulfide isomerase/thioredoxin